MSNFPPPSLINILKRLLSEPVHTLEVLLLLSKGFLENGGFPVHTLIPNTQEQLIYSLPPDKDP